MCCFKVFDIVERFHRLSAIAVSREKGGFAGDLQKDLKRNGKVRQDYQSDGERNSL
jgi:hypothetical protein